MAAAAILENRKIAISQSWFDRFQQNLIIQDGGGRHFDKSKIAIYWP